jgi:DNA-binding MarR family transcriptional regulator
MMTRTVTSDLDKQLSDLSQCTCFNLRKAARSLTQMFGTYMHPTGLGPTQFSLLSALVRRDFSVGHLADVMVTDRTTLTRNLRPLEKQGLIRIVPGKDRRTRIVSLTKRGRNTFEKALPLWRQAQDEIIKRLGRKRWAGLLSHLSATIDASRTE